MTSMGTKLGAKLSKQHRDAIAKGLKGRTVSEETRLKISKSNKGKPGTRNGMKNSPEHRAKISKALKGRIITPEWRKKISDNHGGYKGDNVGYWGIHMWIRRVYGQPTKCEVCGRDGLSGRKIHWANVTGKYLRARGNWKRLCVSCHNKFDNKITNITGRTI